jgi:hypothetical protein
MYIVNNQSIVDKRTAIETAYKQNVLTVLDTVNNIVLTLPEPQRSGTATQQRAYLTQVIDKLCL